MSDRSFVSSKLIKQLTIPREDIKSQCLTLHTMSDASIVECSEIRGLNIQGYNTPTLIDLPKMTTIMKDIPINKAHIPTKQSLMHWPHLRQMASSLPDPMNVRVVLLLEADSNPAHVSLEICTGARRMRTTGATSKKTA